MCSMSLNTDVSSVISIMNLNVQICRATLIFRPLLAAVLYELFLSYSLMSGWASALAELVTIGWDTFAPSPCGLICQL